MVYLSIYNDIILSTVPFCLLCIVQLVISFLSLLVIFNLTFKNVVTSIVGLLKNDL